MKHSFCLSQGFTSQQLKVTHQGDEVSQSGVCPYSLPRAHKKTDSYLRVVVMGMGLSPVHGSRKQLPHSNDFIPPRCARTSTSSNQRVFSRPAGRLCGLRLTRVLLQTQHDLRVSTQPQ